MRVWDGGEAGWEMVGDWSRVPGIKRFHEAWGLVVAFRKPDGTLDNRDGLDLWVADTLNHRILFLDAWAAHPDVSGVTARPTKALFPPAGYQTPSERGRAVLVPFGGSPDQTASEFFNEPWDCEVRTHDGKLYWSNFAGNSIFRANLDGTGVEVVVRGAPQTDGQLGIPSRLYPSGWTLSSMRSINLRDGAVAQASCTRPQAIAFDADGNLLWAERYTYAIRKLALRDGHGDDPVPDPSQRDVTHVVVKLDARHRDGGGRGWRLWAPRRHLRQHVGARRVPHQRDRRVPGLFRIPEWRL